MEEGKKGGKMGKGGQEGGQKGGTKLEGEGGQNFGFDMQEL